MQMQGQIWHTCGPQRFFVRASASGREFEQAQNRRAPSALITRGPAEDVVRGDTPLAVRRASQRNQAPRAGDGITNLNGIADRPNAFAVRDAAMAPFPGPSIRVFRFMAEREPITIAI